MNEKRVTLPPLAAGTPNGEAPLGSNTAIHENPSRQRFPLQSGQDGYVTPTEEEHVGGYSNNNSQHRFPYSARHSANASSSSLAQALREKLQWRERIKHYTWTFFAMTMATGGIANVLYTGTLDSQEIGCEYSTG